MKHIKNVMSILLMVGLTLAPNPIVSAQETQEAESADHVTVLLLGIDTGDMGRVDQGRSDTMILLDMNQVTESGVLISIPRDSYVEIPGYGMDKINHAYAFGGAELSMQTVNNFLGTDIQDYIVVNMAGLKEIVDAVGTIEVTPPTSFEIGGYTFTAGVPMELDSDMALAYARERYTSGGDYARQERQREIIQAVIRKAASIESIVNFIPMFSTLSDNIDTNMNLQQLMQLFRQYNSLGTIDTFQLTGYGEMIDGIYYDQIDAESLESLLAILHS